MTTGMSKKAYSTRKFFKKTSHPKSCIVLDAYGYFQTENATVVNRLIEYLIDLYKCLLQHDASLLLKEHIPEIHTQNRERWRRQCVC
ncbi:hypothetical protein DPMN_027280 [Dreissena polymorpha]|uniref:Uncharacterized protein n=1 Tax=Dreissena polymorpha TaxID=45954 RepID=A0A9D4LUX4_DREPO|nr:hypothetical protein DPMN_027280 [Dreissena polymorpha]